MVSSYKKSAKWFESRTLQWKQSKCGRSEANPMEAEQLRLKQLRICLDSTGFALLPPDLLCFQLICSASTGFALLTPDLLSFHRICSASTGFALLPPDCSASTGIFGFQTFCTFLKDATILHFHKTMLALFGSWLCTFSYIFVKSVSFRSTPFFTNNMTEIITTRAKRKMCQISNELLHGYAVKCWLANGLSFPALFQSGLTSATARYTDFAPNLEPLWRIKLLKAKPQCLLQREHSLSK